MSSIDDIQAQIDHTRAELAATLNELEDKLNVPKQLGVAASKAKASFEIDPKPWLTGAAAAAATVSGIALLALRRR